jgi:hypothetical protein
MVMRLLTLGALVLLAAQCSPRQTRETRPQRLRLSAAAVIDWSNETRRAIVPPGPNGVFGTENYGNKFPGEAAVYMGIVHAAIHDAAVAVTGAYATYAKPLDAPADTSADAAVATAAYQTLVGLEPALGLNAAQRATLEERYAAYVARLPEGPSKTNGIALGARAAAGVLALRANDGREKNPELNELNPPPAGPGVWESGGAPALGLRLPGIRPLALENAAQFRPAGPNLLTSAAYAKDFRQVKELGRGDSAVRTPEQTAAARFWTDNDLRQWNDAMLRLAQSHSLDLAQTARMLAMAHVAGGDAMIACFDAKYAYWFWRPYQAIQRADQDANDATEADAAWQPLATTPNFPEYPSAHACHTTAVVEALATFFGTTQLRIVLDSRITGSTREYTGIDRVIRDVCDARVLAGFHFLDADEDGAVLGRAVARSALERRFPAAGTVLPR